MLRILRNVGKLVLSAWLVTSLYVVLIIPLRLQVDVLPTELDLNNKAALHDELGIDLQGGAIPDVLDGHRDEVHQSTKLGLGGLVEDVHVAAPEKAPTVPHPNSRSKSCTDKPAYYPPGDIPRDSWQVAEPGLSHAFSSYWDDRGGTPLVKIMGIRQRIVRRNGSFPLKCRIWTKDSVDPYITSAALGPMPDSSKLSHHPVKWTCAMEKGLVPYALSLIREKCENALNTIYVRNTPDHRDTQKKHNFTICVPTMYGNYDNIAELVEMVEVNNMFGADKVALYNFSTGPNIQPYLRSYAREGKADIIRWDLPDEYVNNVHNRGLMTVVNDCVYRYMYKSHLVVVADLDELIVPRIHSNWPQMLDNYIDPDPTHPRLRGGALTFRCTFFRKEMVHAQTAQNSTIQRLQLRTQLNVMREQKMWPMRSRTKYIVPPEIVDVAGVHFIHSFVRSSTLGKLTNIDVPVALAFMHHYRLWDDPPGGPPPVQEDTFMHKYREPIVSRVIRRHDTVNGSHF